ncbi:MAG: TrkA family potassium uptake protein, partial [Caldilineaceae bacterium]|nr:TrkA family potassium uptake protein [Caldilineaceae bacterium]
MKQSWRQFLERTVGATETGGTDSEAVVAANRLHLDHRRGAKTNEFVIIGLGRFGTSVAETLVNYGHNVLAIDQDLDRVRALSTTLPHVMQLDATNIDALRQAGVDSFGTGLVCIGSDFESNILATVLLRRLGVEHVIAKARTRTQREILLQVGVDEVILPEHEAGVR